MVECCEAPDGLKVLVVEDEYLIATNLCQDLAMHGCLPIGPFGCLVRASEELESGRAIDAAILDINIGGRPVFPVAERLATRDIPFVFATGYDDWSIPDAFIHIQRLEKPLDAETLIETLVALQARQLGAALQDSAGHIRPMRSA